MSAVKSWPKSNERLGLLGSLASMPSMSTLTWFELVPRMKTEVCPPGPPVWTTFNPGTVFSTSGTLGLDVLVRDHRDRTGNLAGWRHDTRRADDDG